MIVNACGVVLSRANVGEADRWCAVYSETLGRVMVRFSGVNKPGRKLKALSEPMVWAEFRLYLNVRTGQAKAVGGQLINSFPRIRDRFDLTVEALGCCEWLSELTAQRAPDPREYRLIHEALESLEAGRSPWTSCAFGLRLLELAGYGLAELAGPSRVCSPALWTALHRADWERLADFAFEPETARRLRELVAGHVEAQTGRPLKSREFWRQLQAAPMLEAA